MVPVEAQAASRPVIAYGACGALDTVCDGRSGILFDRPDVESVVQAIQRFESSGLEWTPEQIQSHASRFSVARFRDRFSRFYDWILAKHVSGGRDEVRSAMDAVDRDAFIDVD